METLNQLTHSARLLSLMTPFPASLTDSNMPIYEEMIRIIDDAPEHKLHDIYNRIATLNDINLRLIVKLLVFFIKIDDISNQSLQTDSFPMNINNSMDIDANDHDNPSKSDGKLTREVALLSLRQISSLGMSNCDLFDQYKITDDGVKYLILSNISQILYK